MNSLTNKRTPGWATTSLMDVCDLITDGTHHSPPNSHVGDFLYVTAKNIKRHGLDLSIGMTYVSKDVHSEIYKRCPVAFEDVLYIKDGATTGIAVINHLHEPFSMLSSVALIKPNRHKLDPYFLKHWLNSPNTFKKFTNSMTGTAIRRVVLKQIREAEINIPPLAEQKQIAAKLDELLAQVDTIKTRLDAIPHILKRFRQSVLAAAVSGKLTEEWHGKNQHCVMVHGITIPEVWKNLTVGDIGEVKGGKRLPKGESLVSHNTGYPYIRAGQLKNGTVNPDEQLYIEPRIQAQISRYIVREGDAYITIVGACIGDAGIIPKEYDGANLTENAAKITDYKVSLCPAYLSMWLRAQYLQDIIQLEIKSGAQGKLALNRIKELPIPLPSIEEQTEIIRRVEQLFAFADQIEQRVKDAQSRVNHLTQSILAKAFRGELTAEWRAQNPDLITGENSAEALLARIRAEREANTGTTNPRKRKAST